MTLHCPFNLKMCLDTFESSSFLTRNQYVIVISKCWFYVPQIIYFCNWNWSWKKKCQTFYFRLVNFFLPPAIWSLTNHFLTSQCLQSVKRQMIKKPAKPLRGFSLCQSPPYTYMLHIDAKRPFESLSSTLVTIFVASKRRGGKKEKKDDILTKGTWIEEESSIESKQASIALTERKRGFLTEKSGSEQMLKTTTVVTLEGRKNRNLCYSQSW